MRDDLHPAARGARAAARLPSARGADDEHAFGAMHESIASKPTAQARRAIATPAITRPRRPRAARQPLVEDERREHETRQRQEELERRDALDPASGERPVPADVAEDRRHDREEDDCAPCGRIRLRHAVTDEKHERRAAGRARTEEHAPGTSSPRSRSLERQEHRAGDVPTGDCERRGEHEQVADERRALRPRPGRARRRSPPRRRARSRTRRATTTPVDGA